MRQVAAEAGVGVMTVSYTYTRPERVAVATRARVLDAADRLGYRGPDPWRGRCAAARPGTSG
jgi:DNA-binding LacI/PurR family transcriptional regulator